MSRFSFIILFLWCLNGLQTNPIIKTSQQLCQTLVLSYKACAQFSYLDENNLEVQISMGGSNLYTGPISVNNPDPLCGNKFGATVCFEYKISKLQAGEFNACVKVKGTYPFLGTTITDLGCSTVSQ